MSRWAQFGRYQVPSLPEHRELEELVICHNSMFAVNHRCHKPVGANQVLSAQSCQSALDRDRAWPLSTARTRAPPWVPAKVTRLCLCSTAATMRIPSTIAACEDVTATHKLPGSPPQGHLEFGSVR